MYRSADEAIIRKLHDDAKKLDIPVIYSMDDFIFDYEAVRNLDFLHKPGYENYEAYCKKIFQTMNICDGFISSTNALKERMESSFPNKKVAVNRNVASQEMKNLSLKTLHESKSGEIILGYFSGTTTHDTDFAGIQDVILELMKEYKEIRLFVGGFLKLSDIFDGYQERIIRSDYVDYRKLPQLTSQVDINLMPLESSVFHVCKSENKWMEAGLVRVPTIVSWNEELGQIIHDGEDGFLCKNIEEWRRKLRLLVEDDKLRKVMAENVHQRVLKEYTTETIEEEVLDILRVKD